MITPKEAAKQIGDLVYRSRELGVDDSEFEKIIQRCVDDAIAETMREITASLTPAPQHKEIE